MPPTLKYFSSHNLSNAIFWENYQAKNPAKRLIFICFKVADANSRRQPELLAHNASRRSLAVSPISARLQPRSCRHAKISDGFVHRRRARAR
jgi:hypothetical protein